MLKNTSDSFGSIAKSFHWIIAVGILCMLTVGLIMVEMDPSPLKMTLYKLHKSTGVLILLLVIMRIIWRFINPVPQLPASLHPIHHRTAKLSPLALYIFLFLLPLSGFALSQFAGYPIDFYGLFKIPMILPKNPDISKVAAITHKYGAFTLIGILILHVSAALYHHFVLKNNILRRMLPSWFSRK